MLVLHVRLRCGSLSITTQVSLLANEFNVRSVLHGQVSLAAVNQIHVIHEAVDGTAEFVHLLYFIHVELQGSCLLPNEWALTFNDCIVDSALEAD